MVSKEDWRRMGQEDYLMGIELQYINQYTPISEVWEHEHCVFCFAKISTYDGDLHNGYCTLHKQNSHWICSDCFNDFRDEFKWKINT